MGGFLLDWNIATGHYLYRDSMKAFAEGESFLLVEMSRGTTKTDQNFGTTEVYFGIR
jgi:thiol:disulfide interchange protein